VADVELRTPEGTRVHGWLCPVEGSPGAVLFCHGNAGNLSHRADLVAAWQQRVGESVLIFDYPGFGKSGGKVSEAGCYAAADAAYDWLMTEKKIPPKQILLFGESLGGGVAVDLASRRPHGALLLLSTFTSVPDVAQNLYPWLPARWLVRNQFNSLAKIGRCGGPVFVAHGDCDTLIPYGQGERLFAAAPGPKRFLPQPGCGHSVLLGGPFFDEVKEFLQENGLKGLDPRRPASPPRQASARPAD
jgi:fermentation-respiration switch protein FrsA (DUF1100 family)